MKFFFLFFLFLFLIKNSFQFSSTSLLTSNYFSPSTPFSLSSLPSTSSNSFSSISSPSIPSYFSTSSFSLYSSTSSSIKKFEEQSSLLSESLASFLASSSSSTSPSSALSLINEDTAYYGEILNVTSDSTILKLSNDFHVILPRYNQTLKQYQTLKRKKLNKRNRIVKIKIDKIFLTNSTIYGILIDKENEEIYDEINEDDKDKIKEEQREEENKIKKDEEIEEKENDSHTDSHTFTSSSDEILSSLSDDYSNSLDSTSEDFLLNTFASTSEDSISSPSNNQEEKIDGFESIEEQKIEDKEINPIDLSEIYENNIDTNDQLTTESSPLSETPSIEDEISILSSSDDQSSTSSTSTLTPLPIHLPEKIRKVYIPKAIPQSKIITKTNTDSMLKNIEDMFNKAKEKNIPLILNGTIHQISSYGMFVVLNDILFRGLIPINYMDSYLQDKFNSVFKRGDQIQVRVKSIQKEKKRALFTIHNEYLYLPEKKDYTKLNSSPSLLQLTPKKYYQAVIEDVSQDGLAVRIGNTNIQAFIPKRNIPSLLLDILSSLLKERGVNLSSSPSLTSLFSKGDTIRFHITNISKDTEASFKFDCSMLPLDSLSSNSDSDSYNRNRRRRNSQSFDELLPVSEIEHQSLHCLSWWQGLPFNSNTFSHIYSLPSISPPLSLSRPFTSKPSTGLLHRIQTLNQDTENEMENGGSEGGRNKRLTRSQLLRQSIEKELEEEQGEFRHTGKYLEDFNKEVDGKTTLGELFDFKSIFPLKFHDEINKYEELNSPSIKYPSRTQFSSLISTLVPPEEIEKTKKIMKKLKSEMKHYKILEKFLEKKNELKKQIRHERKLKAMENKLEDQNITKNEEILTEN